MTPAVLDEGDREDHPPFDDADSVAGSACHNRGVLRFSLAGVQLKFSAVREAGGGLDEITADQIALFIDRAGLPGLCSTPAPADPVRLALPGPGHAAPPPARALLEFGFQPESVPVLMGGVC